MTLPRVVVLGGGFAGINAVRRLRKAPVEITLIDRRNFHLFQPLLYQVASAAINPSDIAYPIRSVFRGQGNVVGVLMAEVVDIDQTARSVILEGGERIEYDYLVVATGATHSYFGNDQWSEIAPGLKTLEDAIGMRQRILSAFEEAERFPGKAQQLLTFVVVGAGPTGVELAGSLQEIALHAMGREFHAIDPTTAKVILIEGADRVLPTFDETLSASALRQLEAMGVEVIRSQVVSEIDRQGVLLADGERINAATVIWAAGVAASPLGKMLGAPLDRNGRVLVEEDLSVPGSPQVFVVGDLASVAGVPGVAPAAIQMGRHVAQVVVADLDGRSRPAFSYVNKGSLATIGRARAVAQLGPVKLGGFFAWLAWLVVHIFYLIGFRNRLLVLLSWAWNYITFRRGARIITGAPRSTPQASESEVDT